MNRFVVFPVLLGITAVAAGCGSSGRPDDFGTSDGGNTGSGSNTGSGDDGCSAASKLIYVVDESNKLSQFDPTTKMFHDIGTLACQVPNPSGLSMYQPFSMGVDRNATAYVLYVDQNGIDSTPYIFKVDTTNPALPCTMAAFNGGSDLQEFGMGFSTTTAGGDTDQLFIAGGTSVDTASSSELRVLDVGTGNVSGNKSVTGSPELTGNANAELWGFFPDASNPHIEQIDKAAGTATVTSALPASMKGTPMAWAFAFYGGDYYVFLMKDTDSATKVYDVTPAGAINGTPLDTGSRKIVGAGVSTCAPVVIE